MFRTWWQHFPAEVEVAAVQLPGREDRYREPQLRRMAQMVESLATALIPYCDRPFAFAGHSMGGLIAFELTRHLRRTGSPLPEHLFISGRRAPQIPEPLPPIPDLPDHLFVVELQQRYGGLPDLIANDPDLQALFLPTLRADLELIDSYVYEPEPPLDRPLTIFGGWRDSISRSSLAAWQQQTSASFRLHLLPGDHFFVNTETAVLLQLISNQLQGILAATQAHQSQGGQGS
jgi:surfactin synthase thioesterase subunit